MVLGLSMVFAFFIVNYIPKNNVLFVEGNMQLPNSEEAVIAINQAETELFECYLLIHQFERLGGSNQNFLDQINLAADSLSQAYNLFSIGNYSGAITAAVLCETSCDLLRPLLQSAISEILSTRWIYEVGLPVGIGGIIAFGILLFWMAYRRLEERSREEYFQADIKLKPQNENAVNSLQNCEKPRERV